VSVASGAEPEGHARRVMWWLAGFATIGAAVAGVLKLVLT
jgi:hypothetical protein